MLNVFANFTKNFLPFGILNRQLIHTINSILIVIELHLCYWKHVEVIVINIEGNFNFSTMRKQWRCLAGIRIFIISIISTCTHYPITVIIIVTIIIMVKIILISRNKLFKRANVKCKMQTICNLQFAIVPWSVLLLLVMTTQILHIWELCINTPKLVYSNLLKLVANY